VGETQHPPLPLSFNSSLKADFQGSQVTSDSGPNPIREPDPMEIARGNPTDWIRYSLAAIALLYAFFAGLKTVADFDLGWQLATGRYILQHHVIPSADVFSYTAHGSPWIYPPFSGAFFYLLFLAGGYSALSWLGAAATVATVALILRQGSRPAAVLAIIAVPTIAFRAIPRSELFTTVLFAAFAVILWRHYEGRRTWLWCLPLLMLAWVNLHTGFVAGIALMGAYGSVELCDLPFPSRRSGAVIKLRRAFPWLGGSLVATLANPWGWRIYQAIAKQDAASQLHSDFIGEWSGVHFSSAVWSQALSWRDPAGSDWWLLAAAFFAILVTLARKEIGPAIVLAFGAYGALAHLRFQAIFAILVCVIGGSIFSRAARSRARLSPSEASEALRIGSTQRVSKQRVGAWVLASLLALLAGGRIFDLITDRYYLWSGQISLFGAGPSWWYPERAASFLLREHLPGNAFGDYNLGGYLTWRIGPEYLDYFDGRFLPFGNDLFARHRTLMSLPLDSPEWAREADDRNIQTVIFSAARFGGLGNIPLPADCQSRSWTPVYLDDVAAIFVRNRPENAALIHRLGIQCANAAFVPPAIASSSSSRRAMAERFQFLMNAASIEYVLSRDAEAAAAISQAQSLFPEDPDLHLLKAQLAQAHNQPVDAEREYRISLRLRPTDAAWFALAQLYASQRRYTEALPCVLESVALSQQDFDRYRSLGRLYLLMGQPRNALSAFEKALRKSPYHDGARELGIEFDARVSEGEATAYQQLGDSDRAVAAQLQAVHLTPSNGDRWKVLGNLYESAGRPAQAEESRRRAAALQLPPSAESPAAHP
jgi:tetratricopeptide (TPR) repeat protein